jgi:hypothetical protein
MTPRGKLDVDGTIYGQAMMLSSGNTINAIVTSISSPTDLQIPTAAAVSAYVAANSAVPSSIIAGDTTVAITDTGANGQVAFTVNGAQKMIIDQNGNVGIGSTAPTAALDVNGGVNISGSGSSYSTGALGLGSSSTMGAGTMLGVQGGMVVGSAGYFTTAAPSNGVIVSGNVGVGTTDPRSALDINGTASVKTVVLVPPAAVVSVTAGDGVNTVASSFIRIAGSGGAVTVTANPAITTTGIADGQELVLMGTSDVNTVGFTNGNGLTLDQGVPFTLGAGSKLRLIYSSVDTAWQELSRSVVAP